jgi:hypothetical protein
MQSIAQRAGKALSKKHVQCSRGGQTQKERIKPTVQVRKRDTHLIQLIAKVYGIDVVALQVGEHDDLRGVPRRSVEHVVGDEK